MRYLGGAVGHKGLPSNRITIKHLLDKVVRFIHRCVHKLSIRYPEDNLNDVLLDNLWEASAEPARGRDTVDDPEMQMDPDVESAVPSDEEDFGYSWEYAKDSSDSEQEHGPDPEVPDEGGDSEEDLGPEDEGAWHGDDDEYGAL